jgi:hypothetical protein
MKLKLIRTALRDSYTIGHLYVDDKFICDTLEDTDRGLESWMPLKEITDRKIKGKTAIPTGTYIVNMGTVSPKYSTQGKYDWIDAKLPRLVDVPGYQGILIHIGNDATDTDGCILVGENKQKGKVINSTITFEKLYKILKTAHESGQEITIKIDYENTIQENK